MMASSKVVLAYEEGLPASCSGQQEWLCIPVVTSLLQIMITNGLAYSHQMENLRYELPCELS